MTSKQRSQSFALLLVSLFLSAGVLACSDKAAETKPAGAGTGSKSDTQTKTDTDGDGGDDDFDGKDDDVDPKPDTFDLCTGLNDKKSDIEGFSVYIDELCGSENKLPTLQQEKNVFQGGEPKLLKKTDKGDGSVVSVRLFTSTLVKAKASDYFALVRLQVSKPKEFGDNYEHDDSIKMSDVNATPSSSKFTYDYTDGEGRVAYKATARFYSIKKGQAFVSATKMDESIETMKDFKGLIIVNQKDATHTEIFTMSDQQYEVAKDQDPNLYDQSATKKAGNEQKRMYNNADKASEAPGLLK